MEIFQANYFNNDSYAQNRSLSPSSISMADRYVTTIQFSIIGCLGLLTNLLPISAVLAGYVKNSVINVMVANLSVSELILCLSFVFGQSIFVLWRENLPVIGCNLLSYIHFVAVFASFTFPPILAVNRFLALYYAELYKKIYTKRKISIMITCAWLVCALIPFIFAVAGKSGFDEDNDHCCMVLGGDTAWMVAYWVLIMLPLLVFFNGALIYCNYKIFRKLNSHNNGSTLITSVVEKNREILYFLLADMIFPICFHSTYHIFKFVLTHRTSDFLKRFFISLILLNSVLRGLVTIFMLRPYRMAVKKLLCRFNGFYNNNNNNVTEIHPNPGTTNAINAGLRSVPTINA